MKPRASISSSPAPPSPVQKHVQLVSSTASKQLLFKFPDLPNAPGLPDGGDEEKPISDFAILSSYFKMGSCKQVHLGTHILQEQPARPSCTRVDSLDARTPLLTPPPLPRSRSSTPSLRHLKPRFKRSAQLHSATDKVLQRFARGASKCKYRMRLHVAARRYRLRSLVEP